MSLSDVGIQWVKWHVQGIQEYKKKDKNPRVLNPRLTILFFLIISMFHSVCLCCLLWLIYMAPFKILSHPWLKSRQVLRSKSKGLLNGIVQYATKKWEKAQQNNLILRSLYELKIVRLWKSSEWRKEAVVSYVTHILDGMQNQTIPGQWNQGRRKKTRKKIR